MSEKRPWSILHLAAERERLRTDPDLVGKGIPFDLLLKMSAHQRREYEKDGIIPGDIREILLQRESSNKNT